MEAFSKGNYEQAFKGFSELLQKYPKDPLYKYYSGACLVMMRQDPDEAVVLLQQSLNGASVVRSLPPDALFYLGRAQQMSGKFTEAIASFASYSDQVGKKKARDQGVPGFIQECENNKGIVAAAAAKPAVSSVNGNTEISKQPDQPVRDDTEKKPAGQEIMAREQLPPEYEKLLDEALKMQYKADSLTLLAGEQKRQLDGLSEAEKVSHKMKISQNEILAASYQKSADMKYNEAQLKMNPGQVTGPQKEDTATQAVSKEPVVTEENKNISEDEGKDVVKDQEITAALKSAEVYSIFEILPKGAAYPDETIKIDPEVPAGLIYRIQLAVFRNPVTPSIFKGIVPVYGFRVKGTNNTAYSGGMFRKSADAKKALNAVKETGFRDAFIVALSDNKAVSTDRAAVLEKEWGMKSFVDPRHPGVVADTLPPTLSFRVEVIRSVKPMKADAVETLRSMAGSRGLEILHLTDGNYVYLIGKFITFESAAEYADLLVRNNYRSAKVVAWLGNKEIPVDTARQLFNDLK